MLYLKPKKNFKKKLNSFSSSIIIEEYRSGARSKEMYVHINHKQNEKILNYIRESMWRIKRRSHPRLYGYTQTRDRVGNLTPIDLHTSTKHKFQELCSHVTNSLSPSIKFHKTYSPPTLTRARHQHWLQPMAFIG